MPCTFPAAARSALIFDFEKSGTENAVNEHGIEYHRIGFDLISTLLEHLLALLDLFSNRLLS